jgi:transaldolase/transaldolase/glucose-6-phosphate isomerase
MPVNTLNDYRDHGQPKERLQDDIASSERSLEQLADLGISLEAVTQQLEDEGVEKFIQSFDKLTATLERAVQEKSQFALSS